MSNNTSGIDARAYLTGWMHGLTGMYTADINAIPEDKWNANFGGCTRPASAITADAISLMIWTTGALQGNAPAGYDADFMGEVAKECQTREAAIAKLSTTTAEFAAALSGATDEALNTVVTPPWQMDAPLFMLAQIAVSHLWYHDGQLNYIQCLLGDEKVHWMGD